MDKIIEILRDIRPGIDWVTAEAIIDDGILDSFDMIALVSELNEVFKVQIGLEHIEAENFNSVSAIAALLEILGAIL